MVTDDGAPWASGDGPDAEFRAFVRGRSAALMRSAYLLTADVHLAEDLLQSALTKTAVRWKHVRDNPEGYVRKALFHEQVSWWRRRKIAESLTPDLPDGAHEDFSDHATRRLLVWAALRRLTPKQRAVLVLRYYEDLSEAQTAEMLGCSVGTVKSQTRHALARLRILSPELDELRPADVRGSGLPEVIA